MSTQEDISNQLELLRTHRRTLAHYLKQQAAVGQEGTSPAVGAGIETARAEIRRIKGIIRSWGQDVEDHPDDEQQEPEQQTHKTERFLGSGRQQTKQSGLLGFYKNLLIIIIVFTLIVIVLIPRFKTEKEIKYTGRVLDAITQQPIRSAKVTLDFRNSPSVEYTDSEGVYRFTTTSYFEAVAGRIRVNANGYAIYDRNITFSAETTQIEDIRLSPVIDTNTKPESSSISNIPTVQTISTPTLSPDPVPEKDALILLSEAKGWNTVLTDTFEQDVGKWPTQVNGNLSDIKTSLMDGYLYVNMSTRNLGAAAAWTNALSPSVGDFYLSVELKRQTGASDSGAGVLFRKDERGQAYALRIHDDQNAIASRFMLGGNDRIFSIKSAAILPLTTDWNRLEVVAKDTKSVFFVNGTYVGSFDDSQLKKGKIDLFVFIPRSNESATYIFDNLEMRAP